MSELKKKINYTVVCVNEFADRHLFFALIVNWGKYREETE